MSTVTVESVVRQEAVVEAASLPVGPQAVEHTQPVEESIPKRVLKHLERCITLYGQGEMKYRDALLQAGKHAHEYIAGKVAQGATRAAVVKEVEGALCSVAGKVVDVNRLVKCHFAAVLLTENAQPEQWEHVPYRIIRDAFAMAVERDAKCDTYSLVTGKEVALREVFLHVAEKRIDRDGAVALVKGVLGKAKLTTDVTAEPTPDATDTPKAYQPAKGETAPDSKPAPNHFAAMLDAARKGNPKDVAAMALAMIVACQEPDTAMEEFIHLAKDDGDLCNATKRMLDSVLAA